MQDRTSYRAPIRIALDAMGGDFAPAMAIKGALRAARAFDITLILVGDENILWRELEKHKYQGLSLEVRHAPEVIEMGEKPHHMIRKKKRSSLRVAFDLVRNDEAHAIVSAGNSGAVLYGALFVLKRLKHVIRPGIAARMPSASGTVVIIDAGANAICKPENLIEFAVMGSGYFQHVFEIPEPRVGVLSNGEEDSKGTDLTRDTHEQLKKTKLNYIGYVEGRDVFAGKVDVVVCDGFTGNIVIKTAEGVAQNFISVLKSEISRSFFARIGYLMSRTAFRAFKKRFDYREYGGALLLGVDKPVVFAHGTSDDLAFMNAIRVAREYVEKDVISRLRHDIEHTADLYRFEKRHPFINRIIRPFSAKEKSSSEAFSPDDDDRIEENS